MAPRAPAPAADIAADPVRYGQWLFAQACTFTGGYPSLHLVPPPGLPEVAFVGRSNVGKSSLINALLGRTQGKRAVARTSNTPGRTQHLNFFNVADRLVLVDAPGYGFAKAPPSAAQEWRALWEGYVATRPSLRRVCVLIDARRGLMPSDQEVLHQLGVCAVPWQMVVTKADAVGAAALAETVMHLDTFTRTAPGGLPPVLPISAEKRTGLAELRAALAEFGIRPELIPS